MSVVIADFLKRYDQRNKATLTKLTSTLPVFLELLGDKPINQILQADINAYFDDVQKLPVRRDAKAFQGMSLRQIMTANTGQCIAEGTFGSTYCACHCDSILSTLRKAESLDDKFHDTVLPTLQTG